jgi:hypothetical protein
MRFVAFERNVGFRSATRVALGRQLGHAEVFSLLVTRPIRGGIQILDPADSQAEQPYLHSWWRIPLRSTYWSRQPYIGSLGRLLQIGFMHELGYRYPLRNSWATAKELFR